MKIRYIFPVFILGLAIMVTYFFGRSYWVPMAQKFIGKKTTDNIIELYGVKARSKLIPYFDKVGMSYPPKKITLLGMKDQKKLELWASNSNDKYSFIRNH